MFYNHVSIKNLKPNAFAPTEQGYYKVQNIEKYKGNPNNIIYRSSYEKRMCQICDLSNQIIRWSSEPIAITYQSLVDGRNHLYWVDFWLKLKDEKEYIVEVKPEAKLKKPKKSKNIISYNYRLKEYLINMSKFKAASVFAQQIGMNFIIADENFLFKIK